MIIAALAIALACPGETQAEMTGCAVREWRRAEAEMTAAYDRAPHTPLMDASQRAWIVYREAQCRQEHNATPEGSMYGMEQAMCMARLTRERADAIRRAR